MPSPPTDRLTHHLSLPQAWRTIHHNFFIDNYSPQENVDNDDGSAYYYTHDNFLVYGANGLKNDFGGHDNHDYRDIYAYAGQGLGVCDQLKGHEDAFYANKLVTTGNKVGSFRCTDVDSYGKTIIHDNEYYTSDGNINECQMSLDRWQATSADNDKGSTVGVWPRDDVIIGWAKAKLGF